MLEFLALPGCEEKMRIAEEKFMKNPTEENEIECCRICKVMTEKGFNYEVNCEGKCPVAIKREFDGKARKKWSNFNYSDS